MKNQTHLALRGATYYFRCRVPLDLVEAYGKQEISFSLKTKNKKEAIARARLESLRITQEFDHERALLVADPVQELTPIEIERLAGLYLSHLLEEDEECRQEGLSDKEYKDLEEAYAIVGAADAWKLARGRPDEEDDEMEDFLESLGIKVELGTPQHRSLSFAFLKASNKATEMLKARHRGEVVDTPKAEPVTIRRNALNPHEDSLEALREYWESQPSSKGGRKSRTSLAEASTIIKKFKELVGDVKPSQIEKWHIVQLKDKMLEAGSSPATINKGRGILAAIFSTAFDNEKIKVNPFHGMKRLAVGGSTEEKPYTIEELQRIFNSPIFTKGERPTQGRGEAAYWLPLLGLYTGARLNELGQLYAQDIGDEDGIPYLLFKHDEGAGRTIKDKKSRRVPLHSDLIAFGFLEYVEKIKAAGCAQLFPELKTTREAGKLADKWGSWWSGYIRKSLNITRIAQPFHGLRHSFTEHGRKSGMDYEHRMRIEGHALNTVGDKDYGGHLFPLEPLRDALERLQFKGLNLGHLRKARAA